MPNASSLKGVMKFLSREEWRDDFQDVSRAHFLLASAAAGIEHDEIGDVLGEPQAMTLWGCAFEDFLARDLPGGRNLTDDYLKRRSYKESAATKAYMKAIRASAMSLYEVSSIVPGQSFLARDLIRGGEPVPVVEHSATRQMRPWERICARIVPLSGGYRMCGGVLVFDLDLSEDLLDELRSLGARAASEPQKVADVIGGRFDQRLLDKLSARDGLLEFAAPLFTRIWLKDALAKVLKPQTPTLINSDGDDILFCTLRFPLATGATHAAVEAALDALPELRPEGGAFWNLIGPNTGMSAARAVSPRGLVMQTTHSEGGAVLGTIEIVDTEVLAAVNSSARAERIRELIEEALGTLIGAPSLETETLEQARARQRSQPAETSEPQPFLPPAEMRRIAHAQFDEHWQLTLDQPVSMLGGMTPRQAVKTPAGREKVVTWLKYVENGTHRSAETNAAIAGYDVSWLWRELGVAERRV